MKINILSLLILLILSVSINANRLEEEAFSAYKNRDYKKSIALYTKAAKQKSLKALLMLGLLYEKGIGFEQNTAQAIKLYNHILKETSINPSLLKENKNRELTIDALRRLFALTKNPKYKQLITKLQSMNPVTKKSEPLSAGDDFFTLCPSAKKVAPQDREGIESFDCALFENFPDSMPLFMKLRRLYFKAQQKGMQNTKSFSKLKRTIAVIVAPMIKYLQKATIRCYTQAQWFSDIKECDYDYLLNSDPLLFDNAAYRMKQATANKRRKNHKLDIFEKNSLTNALIQNISKHRYGKPWRSMVQ